MNHGSDFFNQERGRKSPSQPMKKVDSQGEVQRMFSGESSMPLCKIREGVFLPVIECSAIGLNEVLRH